MVLSQTIWGMDMNIPKRDALAWFEFFAEYGEEEPLSTRQQELAWAVIAQIERAEEARTAALAAEIPGLKSLQGRTHYVGPEDKFPRGCRSCLFGTGLSAIRKTNRKTNISAATFAGYWTAVNAMGQRWFEWPDKDLVDDVVPMLYDNNMERFETRMKSFFSDTNRPKKGRIVVGIWPNKAWKNYDLDMLKAQLEMIDNYPSGGYAIFSYGAIFPRHEPNDFAKYIKEFNDARPLSDKDKKR